MTANSGRQILPLWTTISCSSLIESSQTSRSSTQSLTSTTLPIIQSQQISEQQHGIHAAWWRIARESVGKLFTPIWPSLPSTRNSYWPTKSWEGNRGHGRKEQKPTTGASVTNVKFKNLGMTRILATGKLEDDGKPVGEGPPGRRTHRRMDKSTI